jgi:hypothetical protein
VRNLFHKHVARPSATRQMPWTHCVVGERCDGVAHGHVVFVEACMCGAKRLIESNMGRLGYGRWTEQPKEVRR